MSEVIHDAQQEFWRPPVLESTAGVALPVHTMAEACPDCGKEFLVSSQYCHGCGARRAEAKAGVLPLSTDVLSEKVAWLRTTARDFSLPQVSFPSWLRYLHFHEIKRRVGLPTASLVAFIIGLGCVLGAVGVSVVYRAQTFADWQAIQFWRIEWLLAATAAFVAGILLRKAADDE